MNRNMNNKTSITGLQLQKGRGRLFKWNPFYCAAKLAASGTGNSNICLTGSAIRSKTTFLKSLLLLMLEDGVQCFVLDLNNDFVGLCSLLAGEQVIVDDFAERKVGAFKKALTVFEFREIRHEYQRLRMTSEVLILKVINQFLSKDQHKPFMIMVDEADRLFDETDPFLAQISEMINSYGGSLVVATQRLEEREDTKI